MHGGYSVLFRAMTVLWMKLLDLQGRWWNILKQGVPDFDPGDAMKADASTVNVRAAGIHLDMIDRWAESEARVSAAGAWGSDGGGESR